MKKHSNPIFSNNSKIPDDADKKIVVEVDKYIHEANIEKILYLKGYQNTDVIKAIHYLWGDNDMFQMKDNYLPSFLSCVRLEYFCARFSDLDEIDKWNATVRWLNICLNKSYYVNEFYEHYHLDRDEELKRIVFLVDKDSAEYTISRNLLDYLIELKDRILILSKLIQDWYYPRYDFEMMIKLTKELHSLRKKHKSSKKDLPKSISNVISLSSSLIIFTSFVISLLLIFSFLSLYSSIDSINPLSWVKFNFPEILSPTSLVLIIYTLSAIILLFIYQIRCILLPRLMGGIMIGYFFLISSDQMVGFSLQTTPYDVFWISCLSIVFSYIFMRFEVQRRISDMNRHITERTLSIFSLGLLESFILGVFTLEIFSGIFENLLKSQFTEYFYSIKSFAGPLGGLLFPKVIILYVPLALLVGIITQLFWEEKPISQL